MAMGRKGPHRDMKRGTPRRSPGAPGGLDVVFGAPVTLPDAGRRTRRTLISLSYVLASSRAWGGQPTASYSGNGIAVTPEIQFRDNEFGPTRIDERHRIVFSGLFDIGWGVQLAPIVQFASSRPYSLVAGTDLDGDGRLTVDRVCQGFDARTLLQGVLAGTVPAGATAFGCEQTRVNSQRSGFIVNGTNIEERSGRFFNVDLRLQKTFDLGERVKIRPYVNFFNLFNRVNYVSLETADLAFINNITDPNFGTAAASNFGRFNRDAGPREIQFGFKFNF